MPNSSTPSSLLQARHERGVFEDETTFPGLRAFRLYDCQGDLVEVALIAEQWFDDEIAAELKASLDRRCPPGEHSHRDPPFPGRLPFKLL